MDTFHLLGFATAALAQNSTNAPLGRIFDGVFNVNPDGYFSSRNYRLIGSYARIPDGTGWRINTPLLRIPAFPRQRYFDLATDPPNLPPFNHYGDSGPPLVANDAISVEVSRGGAATALVHAFLFVSQRMPQPFVGPVRTIQATTSITLSTTAWTAGNWTTFDQLSPGRYAITGMAIFGTGLLAGRLIFTDSIERPGVIAQQSAGEYGWDQFLYGNYGRFGEFEHTTPPSFEAIGYAAGSAQTVQLDVVKIR